MNCAIFIVNGLMPPARFETDAPAAFTDQLKLAALLVSMGIPCLFTLSTHRAPLQNFPSQSLKKTT
jgi:hypothetical protein